MSWRLRIVIILTALFFAAACCWLGFAVYARYEGNEYLLPLANST